jgi:hypothetical protein
MDMRLRVLADPSLVPAVLRGVNRDHQGTAEAVGQVIARDGHQPVVAVHQVEGVTVPQFDACGQHVRVHVLDPSDEFGEVARAPRLTHPVDDDALHLVLRRHLLVTAG